MWPAFVALTVFDALMLGVLPIAGDGGTDLVPALLLAFFFNLLAVAVVTPLVAWRLRRRRPDLPREVAQDHAGTALLFGVTLALLAGGLVHRPNVRDAEHDFIVQQAAAREFAARRAPPEFRRRVSESNSVKLGDEEYRTCVPGPDPRRWFCVLVATETSPPGITVDESREPNGDFNRPGGFR